MKLTRESKNDTVMGKYIDRDRTIDEFIQKLIILIPMAVDPHGQLSPFMMPFLFGTSPKPLTSRANHSNAAEMYRQITTDSCPSGILLQTNADWKRDKANRFLAYLTPAPNHRRVHDATDGTHTDESIRIAFAEGYKIDGLQTT